VLLLLNKMSRATRRYRERSRYMWQTRHSLNEGKEERKVPVPVPVLVTVPVKSFLLLSGFRSPSLSLSHTHKHKQYLTLHPILRFTTAHYHLPLIYWAHFTLTLIFYSLSSLFWLPLFSSSVSLLILSQHQNLSFKKQSKSEHLSFWLRKLPCI